MRLDRIVVGTDFSCASLEATHWAVHRLAPGAEFVLVHAVWIPAPPSFLRALAPNIETLREDARVGAAERLAELERSLGVPHVDTEVRLGRPEDELHAVAAARHADVIVVARWGEHGGDHGPIGRTAENLVRAGSTPVLLATGLHDAAPRHLLAAVDDSPAAAAVISAARGVAERHAATVVVLHVVGAAVPSHLLATAGAAAAEDLSFDEATRPAMQHDGTLWLERAIVDGLPRERVTCETAFGSPALEILAAAERHHTDLVVVGTRGAGAIRRALLGSVADEVLRSARCAVLVVPPPDARAA